jgi:hypothetical protein
LVVILKRQSRHQKGSGKMAFFFSEWLLPGNPLKRECHEHSIALCAEIYQPHCLRPLLF